MTTPAMRVYDVLTQFGGKPGIKLAEWLDVHETFSQRYIGEGKSNITNIKKLLKDDFEHLSFVDEFFRDNYIEGNRKAKKFWSNYERATEIVNEQGYSALSKDLRKTYDGVNLYKKYTDWVWNKLKTLTKKNVNKAEWELDWKDWFAEGKGKSHYVKEYFTRQLTKEASDVLLREGDVRARMIERIKSEWIKGSNAKYTKKITELSKQMQKETGATASKIQKKIDKLIDERAAKVDKIRLDDDAAIAYIRGKVEFRPDKALNKNFDFERDVPIGENGYLDVGGKLIKVYETDASKVLDAYASRAGKFLATVEFAPETTNFKGKHTHSQSNKWAQQLKLGSKEQRGRLSAYAQKAINEQLFSSNNVLNAPYTKFALGASKISSTAALSSPVSPMKNLLYGAYHDFGTYGTQGFLKAWQVYFTDRKTWGKKKKEVEQIGGIDVATNPYTEVGVHESVMKWGMKPSEVANRTRSYITGKVAADEAIKVISGNKELLLFPKLRDKQARHLLKGVMKLTSKEIDYIERNGLEPSSKFTPSQIEVMNDMRRKIYSKINKHSHGATQGLTTSLFMPLWSQNGLAKPLTSLHRMAYAASRNTFTNIVRPLSFGNPLPMMRYIPANMLVGTFLWNFYDLVLGMQRPSQDKLEEFVSNAYRADMLGALGTVADNKGTGFDLNDILLYRMMTETSRAFIGMAKGAWTGNIDFVEQSASGLLKSTVVAYNHAERAYNNYTDKFITDYKKSKTLERKFLVDKGRAESKYNVIASVSERTMWYNSIRQSFLKGDVTRAAERYWATFYYLTDDLMRNSSISRQSSRLKREKEARKKALISLNSAMVSLKPLKFSMNSKEGRRDRAEFLEKLTPEQKEIILKSESRYKTLYRLFENEIQNLDNIRKYSAIFKGQYEAIKL